MHQRPNGSLVEAYLSEEMRHVHLFSFKLVNDIRIDLYYKFHLTKL